MPNRSFSLTGTPPLSSMHNSTNSGSFVCNPHSTTSPKSSPSHHSPTTNHSSSIPTPDTRHPDLDVNENLVSPTMIPSMSLTLNNNRLDDDHFENDNISVTGSNSILDEDDKHTTPSPPLTNSGGAFTALIKRNHNQTSFSHPHLVHPEQLPTSSPFKKSAEFLSGFTNASSLQQQQQQQHPSPHAFNHALAAQLFLQQSPLIPQPSQWLYSQLYSNYNDMPWFRNSLPSATGISSNFRSTSNDDATVPPSDKNQSRDPLARRAIKLVTHQQKPTDVATSSLPDDDEADASSPPVSSSRRSPSPGIDQDTATPTPDDEADVVVSDGKFGPIRRSPKMVNDVWRPY